jgi:hypothetical protein
MAIKPAQAATKPQGFRDLESRPSEESVSEVMVGVFPAG